MATSDKSNAGNGSSPPGDPSVDEELSDFDAVAAAAELSEALGDDEPVSGPSASIDEYVRTLESEVETLNVLLRQKDELIKRADERAERAQDEVERSKERLEREARRELDQRTDKLLRSFLEVLDDLDRALEAARTANHTADVLDGVELVRKSFLRKLSDLGIERQLAEGQRFDPERFEAVSMVPVADASLDGMIIGVVRAGYERAGQPMRPARVAVGKKS